MQDSHLKSIRSAIGSFSIYYRQTIVIRESALRYLSTSVIRMTVKLQIIKGVDIRLLLNFFFIMLYILYYSVRSDGSNFSLINGIVQTICAIL